MADNERVEIQIHVDGATAVATLKELEGYINRLNGKSVNIGVNAGGSRGSGGRSGYPGSELSRLGESLWSRELLADQKRIARMEAERTKNARASYENWWKTTLAEQERREKALEKYKTDSAVLRQRIAAEQIRKEEAWDKEQAQNRVVAMQREADAWANYYGRRTTTTQFLTNLIGGAVSGLGNISNGTASFASGIGSAFSGMGSMFNFDTTTIARRYITRLATRAVLGNLDSSIARADIMNTFVPYMALAGVDQNTAQNALNRINQSILGLPIGLDEAAQRLRRYQMFMGDTEAATNMTIGIQNAIMAGGASEQMKTQAYYQIDRLLSAGKLSTSRQWLALLQGLGVSTRFLAQEMGVAGMNAKEMAAGLTSGQISTDVFLKALQRLATNRDINKALDIYKNTYESWISNIGFAFKRGNANVLNALSDSLISSTGVSTLGYMQLFRNGVNAAYTGAVNWLGENPSIVGGAMSSIQGLAGAMGGINYGSLATSIFGNIGRVVDYVASSINKVSGGKLEDFVSFATTLAAPIGGVFKAVSGGLPAMLGVFDRFKDFNFEGLMDNIAEAAGSMANLVSGGLGLVSDNAMSRLLAYGLVWGRPAGAALGAIGNGVRGVGNILNFYNQGMGALAAGNYGASPLSAWLYGKGYDRYTVDQARTFFADTAKPVAAGGALSAIWLTGLLSQISWNKTHAQDVYDEMFGVDFLPDMSALSVSSNALYRSALNFSKETKKQISNGLTEEAAIETRLAENETKLNDTLAARDDLIAERAYIERKRLEAIEKRDASKVGGVVIDEDAYGASLQAIRNADDALVDMDKDIRKADSAVARYNADQDKLNKLLEEAKQKANEYSSALQTGVWTENAVNMYITRSQETATAFKEAISDPSNQASLAAFFAGTTGVELPSARYYNTEYGQDAWRPSMKKTMAAEKDLIAAYDIVSSFFSGTSGEYSESKMKEGAAFIQSMLEAGGEEGISNLLGAARRLGSGNTTEIQEFFEDAHTWAQQSGLIKNVENTATALNTLLEAWQSGGSGLVNYTNALAQFQPVAQETINTLNEGWKGSGGSKKDLVDAVFGGGGDLGSGLGSKTANAFSSLVGAAEEATTAVDGVTTAATELDGVWKKGGESARGAFKEMVDAAGSASTGISAAAGTMAASLSEPLGKAEAIAAALDSLSGRSIFATVNVDVNLPPGVTLEMLTNGFAGGSTTHENNGHVFGGSGGSFGSQGGSGIKPNSSLQPRSRGGVVYASNGMFIPHGTDTVPAMLTPGEYVVRRKAAAAFGKAFMDRVNALDIHGAFRALSHRMNVPSTGSFIANNQRTYDNHASVTQNIVTNSQSFTHRRARRWVRALT